MKQLEDITKEMYDLAEKYYKVVSWNEAIDFYPVYFR